MLSNLLFRLFFFKFLKLKTFLKKVNSFWQSTDFLGGELKMTFKTLNLRNKTNCFILFRIKKGKLMFHLCRSWDISSTLRSLNFWELPKIDRRLNWCYNSILNAFEFSLWCCFLWKVQKTRIILEKNEWNWESLKILFTLVKCLLKSKVSLWDYSKNIF